MKRLVLLGSRLPGVALIVILLHAAISVPTLAQTSRDDRNGQSRNARVNGAEIGERRNEQGAAGRPVSIRIENRFNSRIGNRLRNRIDRSYDPPT